MKEGELYSVAESLGQPPLVGDSEFFAFVIDEGRTLALLRRMQLHRILQKEPWRGKLEREKERARKSSFVNPRASAMEDRWKEQSTAAHGSSADLVDSEPARGPTFGLPRWRTALTAGLVVTAILVGVAVFHSLRGPLPTDVSSLVGLSTEHLDEADNWFGQTRNNQYRLKLLEPVDDVIPSLSVTLRWSPFDASVRVQKVSLFQGSEDSGRLINSVAGPTVDFWHPSQPLSPNNRYSWQVEYVFDDVQYEAVARFRTPSREALAFIEGRLGDLKPLQKAAILIELQRYEDALTILKRARAAEDITTTERETIQSLIKRLGEEARN